MMGISPSLPPAGIENGLFALLQLLADPEKYKAALEDLVSIRNDAAIKLQAVAELDLREKKLSELEATVANDRAAIEAEKVALARRLADVTRREAEIEDIRASLRAALAAEDRRAGRG